MTDDSQYSHDLRLAIEGCVAFDRECGTLQSSSSEEMLQQLHDQLIAAACIQPQFMQSARESLRSQHDLHRLTLVLMGATILDIGEAFALASELRDRYRNAMTVQHLIDAVNAGRLMRVSRGYVVLPVPDLRYYSGGDSGETTQEYVNLDVAGIVDSLAQRFRPDSRRDVEVIGDRACKFNAQSSFLRCAVNPSGPCEGCDYFESEERDHNE